jgi:hypothetical protein
VEVGRDDDVVEVELRSHRPARIVAVFENRHDLPVNAIRAQFYSELDGYGPIGMYRVEGATTTWKSAGLKPSAYLVELILPDGVTLQRRVLIEKKTDSRVEFK